MLPIKVTIDYPDDPDGLTALSKRVFAAHWAAGLIAVAALAVTIWQGIAGHWLAAVLAFVLSGAFGALAEALEKFDRQVTELLYQEHHHTSDAADRPSDAGNPS